MTRLFKLVYWYTNRMVRMKDKLTMAKSMAAKKVESDDAIIKSL